MKLDINFPPDFQPRERIGTKVSKRSTRLPTPDLAKAYEKLIGQKHRKGYR